MIVIHSFFAWWFHYRWIPWCNPGYSTTSPWATICRTWTKKESHHRPRYVVSTVDGSFHLLHAFSLANLVSLAVMPSTVPLFHAKLFLQPSTDVIWVFRKILGEIPWRSPLFISLSGEARKRAISETKSMTTAYIRHTGWLDERIKIWKGQSSLSR